MKLGFSTGTLYKAHKDSDSLKIIKKFGCNSVEIKLGMSETDGLDEVSAGDLAGFAHVSIHAPAFGYGNNKGTPAIFKRIERINNLRKLDTVVFHPDPVEDFSVFEKANFNVAFENMDNRKKSHQRPEEMEAILSLNDRYKMVLDVNHIKCNDSSMKLAEVYFEKFGDRITEIHLSGYKGSNGSHEPLFETKQPEIIRAIRDFDIPIIIESVISPETMKMEIDYITSIIGR